MRIGNDVLALAILFLEGFHPARIGDLLVKAGQLGQEFMGSLGEDCFDLVLVAESQDVASVAGGKVEDRLPEANEDVLSLPGDKRFSISSPRRSAMAIASR